MGSITLLSNEQTFVHIPYWFIMDYMPKALSGYSKVYIYLFARCTDQKQSTFSLEDIASQLDMLYSEVLQALRYWDQQGILTFKDLANEEYVLDFKLEKPILKESGPTTSNLPLSKVIIAQSRPEYRTEEINLYIQDSVAVTNLFKIAEEYLGRLLTITDQKILYSLYDWLHMPFDLIEFLIEYCASTHNKVTTRYIEKVAIAWVDEDITTIEKAKEKVSLDKKYFKVLSSLGASKSNITLAEKKCIDKWFTQYQLSIDIILEACRRAVMQTNKPSLNYVDSILKSWSDTKVKTLEDIALIDQARESKKQLSLSHTSSSKAPTKPTKFTNIHSHNWDFEEIQKLEREYVQRKLNGGS